MGNVYKTATGKAIDLDRLKLQNETVVAVGNAGLNTRGDLVKGSKIVKTREQLSQEYYNISGNNVVKDAKIKQSATDIVPDEIVEPFSLKEKIKEVEEKTEVTTDAISKSKELAEKLAQRKKN